MDVNDRRERRSAQARAATSNVINTNGDVRLKLLLLQFRY